MTTSAARRRRSTIIALAITGLVVVLAGGITAVATSTLLNSREGRNAAADELPTLQLPDTSTALVGVIDDAGALTSAAALVLSPSGAGGSIVVLPATADSSLGLGDDRFPLAETLAVDGPEAFRAAAEALASVSFDVAELVDAERLTALLQPLGALTVEVSADVVSADGEVVLAAGESTIDIPAAVTVLTTAGPDGEDHVLEPARLAIWRAIAAAVGEGLGSAAPAPAGAAAARPVSLDAFTSRLYAGETGARGLTFTVPTPDRNPRGVDVVVPDRAELLLVFGQVAPARVAAPNQSLTFRLESYFDEDDLAELGVNNADIARDVINRLLYVQANVVSVVGSGGEPPEVTQVYVADPGVVSVVTESYPLVFGELEVVPSTHRIEGVDVIVVLGRTFLDKYEGDIPDELVAAAEDFLEGGSDDEPDDTAGEPVDTAGEPDDTVDSSDDTSNDESDGGS